MKEHSPYELPLVQHVVDTNLAKGRHFPSGTVVVGVQHIMAQTISFVHALNILGVEFHDIFLCGKYYSTNQETVQALRNLGVNIFEDPVPPQIGKFQQHIENNIRKMWCSISSRKRLSDTNYLILDDGGRALAGVPLDIYYSSRIAGVEQTSSGLHQRGIKAASFPIVSVANSAAKQQNESPFIGESIVKSIIEFMPNWSEHSVGVLGFGSIGKSVAAALERRNKLVTIFDLKRTQLDGHKFNVVPTKRNLINRCQIIIGCTGVAALSHVDFKGITEPKYLFSGSSEDIEFSEIISSDGMAPGEDSAAIFFNKFMDSGVPNVQIARAGYPVNFNQQPVSLPLDQIQLTMSLLLEGLLQASRYYFLGRIWHMDTLHLDTQQMVLDAWFRLSKSSMKMLESWNERNL